MDERINQNFYNFIRNLFYLLFNYFDMKSKNRKELLENTINYYNSNNRAVNGMHECEYITTSGKRCAIGREISGMLAIELEGAVEDVFDQLPVRLQRMGKDFLTSIQQLHDVSLNWDENGLTPEGENAVKRIREKYNL